MLSERQEQIIEESIKLIDNKGIQGFTIKNLSKEIGISEPGIYKDLDETADKGNKRSVIERGNEEAMQVDQLDFNHSITPKTKTLKGINDRLSKIKYKELEDFLLRWEESFEAFKQLSYSMPPNLTKTEVAGRISVKNSPSPRCNRS